MVELDEIEKVLEGDADPEGRNVESVGRGMVLLEDGLTLPVEPTVLELKPELPPVGVTLAQLLCKVVVVVCGNVMVAVFETVLVLS